MENWRLLSVDCRPASWLLKFSNRTTCEPPALSQPKTRLGDSQAASLFSTFCWLQEDSTSTLAPNVALALESKDDSDLRSVTVKEWKSQSFSFMIWSFRICSINNFRKLQSFQVTSQCCSTNYLCIPFASLHNLQSANPKTKCWNHSQLLQRKSPAFGRFSNHPNFQLPGHHLPWHQRFYSGHPETACQPPSAARSC